ncbi:MULTISPECIES: hypothetical protein [Microbacterium]|uniref:hypothetical protein n=1 Tax=Microbacterium TaxID=33882 RepID=UPI00214CF9A1|nr:MULTISPECIES: hypothetical protein [unclassified Microbacterium]MCR2811943.1 hypothetical protein [Microbacterium sp. zg.Y1084]MDL5486431.1 hypothetical protein [Microbacterium sp. zg-Y1211]
MSTSSRSGWETFSLVVLLGQLGAGVWGVVLLAQGVEIAPGLFAMLGFFVLITAGSWLAHRSDRRKSQPPGERSASPLHPDADSSINVDPSSDREAATG